MYVVSGGIAEALVTTALGIFVAIPAVAAFNYFTGRIENFHIEMNRASTQMVNRLFKVQGIDRVAKMSVNAEENEYAAR
jgi:biopolymer transport protein ExbB/biopolymer transport protein TolQ